MRRRGRPPTNDVLTPREWEVLDLIREGLTNRQIAERLDISLSGVKHHVQEILSKLDAASREDAAARPLQRRLPALVLPLIALIPRPRAGTLATALGAAAISGVVLLSLAAFVFVVSGSRESMPREASEALRAEAEQAQLHALEIVPDAVLRQIDFDASRGETVFRFTSAASSQEVQVSQDPTGKWQTASLDSAPLLTSSSRPLDASGMRVDWMTALAVVQQSEPGCVPISGLLSDQGDLPAWYVYCQNDRYVGTFAVDAWTGDQLVPAYIAGSPPLDTAPEWSAAHLVSREGALLTVRLDRAGEDVRIDLSQIAVFDCRTDCFVNNGGLLGPVSQQDELCIGWLGIRGDHQDGKLWVNRYSCEAGGRVIPPEG